MKKIMIFMVGLHCYNLMFAGPCMSCESGYVDVHHFRGDRQRNNAEQQNDDDQTASTQDSVVFPQIITQHDALRKAASIDAVQAPLVDKDTVVYQALKANAYKKNISEFNGTNLFEEVTELKKFMYSLDEYSKYVEHATAENAVLQAMYEQSVIQQQIDNSHAEIDPMHGFLGNKEHIKIKLFGYSHNPIVKYAIAEGLVLYAYKKSQDITLSQEEHKKWFDTYTAWRSSFMSPLRMRYVSR